mmetsp:Transcript_168748/g.542325  ORF Transcript_168748/g.542325 Transcript_168748/m.542325 type:complete len:328 (-) Transcript_168748:2049-3032(-)
MSPSTWMEAWPQLRHRRCMVVTMAAAETPAPSNPSSCSCTASRALCARPWPSPTSGSMPSMATADDGTARASQGDPRSSAWTPTKSSPALPLGTPSIQGLTPPLMSGHSPLMHILCEWCAEEERSAHLRSGRKPSWSPRGCPRARFSSSRSWMWWRTNHSLAMVSMMPSIGNTSISIWCASVGASSTWTGRWRLQSLAGVQASISGEEDYDCSSTDTDSCGAQTLGLQGVVMMPWLHRRRRRTSAGPRCTPSSAAAPPSTTSPASWPLPWARSPAAAPRLSERAGRATPCSRSRCSPPSPGCWTRAASSWSAPLFPMWTPVRSTAAS